MQQAIVRPASRKAGGGESLSRQIFWELSERIISFKLKPFESLSEVSIAEELGVSRTPTREALVRLVDLGLVEVFPQRGTFVTPLRMPDLAQSQFLRESLEIGLLRRAFERGEFKALVSGLRAEIAIQRTCADLGEMEQFYDSDERFHRRIAEAAGMPNIAAEIDRVKVHMDRFRHLMITGIEDIGSVLLQHVSITDAIEAGDLPAVEAAMQAHLRRIMQYADKAMDAFPHYFESTRAPVSGMKRRAAVTS